MEPKRSRPFSPGPTEHFGAARTLCIIDPENRPSIRLAQRFNYAQFGRGAYKEKQFLLLERARSPGPV